MFPFCFEWIWQSDHYIFLGLLYLALIIMGGGITYALFRTWVDLELGGEEHEAPSDLGYRSRYSNY